MNCCLPIGSYVPVRKPKRQRAYLRRKSASLRQIKQSSYACEIEAMSGSLSIGGRILAICCLMAGSSLFYMAGRDYLYYAPIRKCAISFLEGLANKEMHNSGQNASSLIEIKVHDISIEGNRAVVNAALATPGNWINTELYAVKKEKSGWKIVGVTQIDAHVEDRQNLDLANEIETAFRSIPGVQTKRY